MASSPDHLTSTSPPPECRQDAYLWRFLVTAAGFLLFGTGAFVVGVVILPLVSILSAPRDKRRRRARAAIRLPLRFYLLLLSRLGGLRYEMHGLERLGRPGQLIIANHPTLLDVVFLLAFVPSANCVVKQALWRNLLTRNAVTLAEYITNQPTAEMIDAASRALAEGQALIMFPEGTRTRPGEPMAFHRGAANVALRAARCVTPVYISCEPTTLTKTEPWYRIPARRPRFTLDVGEDLEIDAFRQAPVPAGSRSLNAEWQAHFEQRLSGGPA